MNLVYHEAASRGCVDHGWLKAHHSFSFADFYNSKKMNFGSLRVLNDDLIAPGMGFGTHPHENMEIITIPLSGHLKHKDSMGINWKEVNVGEVQVMSAGTGIQHSEINGSKTEYLSLFQIWIIPNKKNVNPRYDQAHFEIPKVGKLQVLVSSISSVESRSLKIHQDAQISRIKLEAGSNFNYSLKSNYHGVYIMQVIGVSEVAGQLLNQRDALGISKVNTFSVKAVDSTELLFIEVPI
ncbi:MAG: pirin family protein [Flavobacteriaceae bacterium]|nr:pirin family protein [Flavobacteriaceae bacterium]